MTEETKTEGHNEAQNESADTRTPMERAVAGGFKEEGEPSREDRVKALIAHMEHAAKHNAPIGHAMLKEMRELLSGTGDDEVDGD